MKKLLQVGAFLCITTLMLAIYNGYKTLHAEYISLKEKMEVLQEKLDSPVPIKTDEKIRYTKNDVWCLAKNIFYEAATEPYIGKLAVAQVTLNRVKSKQWANTICDVVYEHGQFSWTYDQSKRWKSSRGQNWENSKMVAEQVLKENVRLNGFNHVYYYHADYVRPKWAHKKYEVARIGAHIFYEDAL